MRALDKKYAFEEYFICFDFSNVIVSSEIDDDEITIAVVDSNGVDKTTDITESAEQVSDATKVHVWVKGGVAEETYTISCKVITTSDPPEKYELKAKLTIKKE